MKLPSLSFLRPSSIRAFLGKMVWRSYIYGLVVMLVVGGGYEYFYGGSTQSTAQNTSVSTVTRQTLTENVQAAGKVTFASEQQLKFNQRGTVAKVSFKEGDHVKQGQIIAELDASTVLSDIRSAELSIGAGSLHQVMCIETLLTHANCDKFTGR